MAVIRNFTAKASKTRERVQKHRRLKKLKKKYEEAVSIAVERKALNDIGHIFEENDVPNANIPDCKNANDEEFDIENSLRQWAVKHRITQMAINDLLSILITAGFCFLPKDSRTFMKTPKHVEIDQLSSGKMWYRGISDCLKRIFQKVNDDLSIYLDFNFDGVPLFESSTKCFWPIIVSIREYPRIEPFIAGIWCGISKPPLNEYLSRFVSEMKVLLTDGLTINSHHVEIKFGLCICDTPARALIKGTVLFNHRHGCQKCLVIGVSEKRTMCFPDLDAIRRTDLMFRQRTDPPHHKETTLLEELPINMISTFKVSDTLHHFHLGIMKRSLQLWTGKGSVKDYTKRKWSKTHIESTSSFIQNCNGQMPSDIHRSLRGLDSLGYWKGVEFRTILLYVGMVAFRSVLPRDEYEHFLTLCCAVTICCCEKYKKFIPVASKMFKNYVENYKHFYGRQAIGSNVHNLIHVTEEMIEHNIGNLEKSSTYKYENCLRLLGMKLQSCNRPLEQISRRLIETSNLDSDAYCNEEIFSPSVEKELPHKSNMKIYSKVNISTDLFLSSHKSGDSWFLTKSGDIVKMEYATKNQTYEVCGFPLVSKEPFFLSPLSSDKLNIFQSDGILNNNSHVYDISLIAAKMICLELESYFVFIPILHSLELLNK